MEVLQHMTFRDETVILDDRHFLDCTLQNCTMEYSGGPVILERTHLRGRPLQGGYEHATKDGELPL